MIIKFFNDDVTFDVEPKSKYQLVRKHLYDNGDSVKSYLKKSRNKLYLLHIMTNKSNEYMFHTINMFESDGDCDSLPTSSKMYRLPTKEVLNILNHTGK